MFFGPIFFSSLLYSGIKREHWPEIRTQKIREIIPESSFKFFKNLK